MAKKFLYRADVVATFEQVRREAMSKRVTTTILNYLSFAKRASDCGLYGAVGKVMPSLLSVARINRSFSRGKDILPTPLPGRSDICARVCRAERLPRSRQRDPLRAEA